MKRFILALCALCFCLAPHVAPAEIIAQWNFNNAVLPSCGQGTASLLGGVTATFATGSTNDPASTGNTGWNTTQYPAQATGNKTAGAQFDVSTLGYSDIVVRWDHRVSSSASKYCRLQYSSDGMHFLDLPGSISAAAVSSNPSYYEPQTNDLTTLAGVEDNPDFAFRIVSEFESSVLPFGTEEYVTTYGTNQYSRAGTIRFDMVTVFGAPIAGTNTPPHISAISDQTVRLNQSAGPLSFAVSDAEDPPEALAVGALTSNPSVVPQSNINVSGSGAERSVLIAAGTQPGVAMITLRVTDTGGRSGVARFLVTVLPDNTPPFVSSIAGTNLVEGSGSTVALPFTVGDLETLAENLTVTGRSGNPPLIPNNTTHISCGGSGSNRFVLLTPAPGARGPALITLEVSDGAKPAQSSFPFAVTPSGSCVFFEPFGYSDGSVVTNSGFLWATRSGTPGDCRVTAAQLQLANSRTEDVLAPLPGAPYAPGARFVIYSSFRIKFLGVPRFAPEYFAHLFGGGSFRARIYAGASEAWPGGVRLYVANGSATNQPHAATLSTNTYYTVVSRYAIDTAATTLWVNPASEATPGAVGGDPQSSVSINSIGFRQESTLGAALLIDDLKVGLSFASVTSDSSPNRVLLCIDRLEATTVLHWNDPTFGLQASPASAGPFTNLAGTLSPFTNSPNAPSLFFRLYQSPQP
ncbi:MAG TPA: hypothetical protein VJA21_06350 [Verrucomicrobiae bacterium]